MTVDKVLLSYNAEELHQIADRVVNIKSEDGKIWKTQAFLCNFIYCAQIFDMMKRVGCDQPCCTELRQIMSALAELSEDGIGLILSQLNAHNKLDKLNEIVLIEKFKMHE